MGLLRIRRDQFHLLSRAYMSTPNLFDDPDLPFVNRVLAACWDLASARRDLAMAPTSANISAFGKRISRATAIVSTHPDLALSAMAAWWTREFKRVFSSLSGCLALDGVVHESRLSAFLLCDIGMDRAKSLSMPVGKMVSIHPAISVTALGKAGIREESAILAALQHHERIGGGGYPFGHARISEIGSMAAITDSFGGMLCPDIAGKEPKTVSEALRILSTDSGYLGKNVARFSSVVSSATKKDIHANKASRMPV